MPSEEEKPIIDVPIKSSMEILSELFSTFDAEPPVIVKKEKEDSGKKHKKSKKKHKHKEKKHKKKSKKRKRSCSNSSNNSGVDLTDILNDIPEEVLKGIPDAQNADKAIKTEPDIDKGSEKCEKVKTPKKSDDDKVKTLKYGSIFDATILAIKKQELCKTEEGEITDSEMSNEMSDFESKKEVVKKDKHKKKRKHSKRGDEKSKKRKRHHRSESFEDVKKNSRSPSISRTPDKCTKDDDRNKDRHVHKSKDKLDKDKDKFRDEYKGKEYKSKYYDDYRRCEHKSRERSDYRNREQDDFKKSKEREDYDDKKWRSRDNPFYNDHANSDKDDKWFMRERYRGYTERDRDRKFREKSIESHIDKKKLLEIARKNAIQMMKSGSLPGALTLGPQAQEKVIAAIKSGGKTVEELTDFCKTLSKKEELGELSSVSEDNVSESDSEKPFHHPFQLKERPMSITMNIKNSVPLPLKNSQERASELRIQFPVSSGQQHRKTEKEWVPVSPKKIDASNSKPTSAPTIVPQKVVAPLAIEAAPALTPPHPPPPPPPSSSQLPGPQVFPPSSNMEQNIDIAAIVSQRLSAMRMLQENPNDVQALSVMYKAQKEMNTWAESKQQIGQFTGSTGAQILTQAELSSGFQAWARKDQLQTAAPLSGGMGMHLLQKMGWKPGEGLGKEKTGTLEPLLLEVKLDKKGIVAKEEQKKKQPKLQKNNVKVTQGKHPVSLLGEYASKHKLGAPQYDLCFECGPDHKKNFLFRVILNGAEYKPQIASPNKKEAKANSALICLQQLGILPI